MPSKFQIGDMVWVGDNIQVILDLKLNLTNQYVYKIHTTKDYWYNEESLTAIGEQKEK